MILMLMISNISYADSQEKAPKATEKIVNAFAKPFFVSMMMYTMSSSTNAEANDLKN